MLAVLGSARCLWDDVRRLGEFRGDWLAINTVGCFIEWPLQHWASLHPEFFSAWATLREPIIRNGRAEANVHNVEFHSHKTVSDWRVRAWPQYPPTPGTSALFAAKVGLALGYERVILCGVPLDGTGSFYHSPWREQKFFHERKWREPWVQAAQDFGGRVRSMSGYTAELLGGL